MKALLARTPLRVKLVAAALALVLAALLVTASVSALALHSYLIGRIDDELADTTHTYEKASVPLPALGFIVLPSDYMIREQTKWGVGRAPTADLSLRPEDLPPLPKTPQEHADHLDHPYTVPAINGSRRWRLLITQRPNGAYLVVGQKLNSVDNAVNRLVAVELVVGGSVLVVLAALGVALVRASLRPLVEIERTAAQIAAGQLGQRVPESDPRTEVGRLARALNAMLTQIEWAFAAQAASEQAARAAEAASRDAESGARSAAEAAKLSEARARLSEERMRQFVADASHELRTPLTTIRGFAELYRQGAVEPDQIRDVLRRIEDEAARMGLLVEDLLLLARLDQERPLVLAPVELRVLAGDAVEAAHAIAPDRPLTLDAPADGRPLLVLGDEPRLRQVVGNLMTNALTHTPPATPVTLRLSADDATAVLEVIDAGPGIAAEQADRVFQRFYRVDKARTRQAAARDGQAWAGRHSGAGLGLAIVAALVAAHDGAVEVDSVSGQGATFRVRLPLLGSLEELADHAALPETSQAGPSSSEASTGIVEA
ncbi:sensor histidine kinase [Planosporangium mesophilum]|uniref:histidine kinase n=1 Tax=Planosporangium mesophilum TaxID=689768 RepID=A0A8J3T715_9ACTN|nr:HAMP domain-containing sensor histidine kinase [Planosporangium mesophilum]NJC81323.1 HAMP domain-containing protein [Planosporangium mesophilum]GII21024.1 putative sensor histidine kinase PhoR [Planosporangium mesophilum]